MPNQVVPMLKTLTAIVTIAILSFFGLFWSPMYAVSPVRQPTITLTATLQAATSTPKPPTLTASPVPPTATVTATPLPQSSNPTLPLYSNLVLNIDVLFESHQIAHAPKAANEYRVILIGDSGVSAEYLPFSETMTGILNDSHLKTCDNRDVVVYNMALQGPSLVKDLVFVDKAVQYQPDLVIWYVTLNSFRPDSLLTGQNFLPKNRAYIEDLNKRYNLGLITFGLQNNTQTPEEAWKIVAQSKDPEHQKSYRLPPNDVTNDSRFSPKLQPPKITAKGLHFDLFYKGIEMLSKTKTLVVNEPMFIATGNYSNIRYNQYYPRWVYDQYREILLNESKAKGWAYLDLWDFLPQSSFARTALHPNPAGEKQKAEKFAPIIQQSPCQ